MTRGKLVRWVGVGRTSALACLAIVALCASPVRGAVTTYALQLQDVVVNSDGVNPTTGFIEAFISYDFYTTNLSAFNLDFLVTSTDVTFGSSTTATMSSGPLFPSPSYFSDSASTAQHEKASADVFVSQPAGVHPLPGHGLLRVPFTVAVGQTGVYAVQFGLNNKLFDATTTAQAFDSFNGSITVLSAVPEAAAWAQLSLGAVIFAAGVVATRIRRWAAV